MDDIKIEPGTPADIGPLARLYDDLNDWLARGVNYPGWIKGVYPVREIAENGLKEGALFVARRGGALAGSVILSHRPEQAYRAAKWLCDAGDADMRVIRTLVIHPDCLRSGIGTALLDFAEAYGTGNGIKSLRLDVFVKNLPAVKLYEKRGFTCVGTADLGLGRYGLDTFYLYEKRI